MNSTYEKEYKDLLRDVLINGTKHNVRDNNVTYSMFGKSLSFNNRLGLFPMLTSKEMFFKNVKFELAWILKGLTNVNYLRQNGVSIWNLWADDNGEIGNTYGSILRNFNGIDQFGTILRQLETDNYSRQLVISLWNPVAIDQGNLKPCYHSFQFVVIGNTLNIQVSQRSADLFIGLPYDIAVFSLLNRIITDNMGFTAGVVNINIGNVHIYKEHIDSVNMYLNNEEHNLPRLANDQSKILNFDTSKVYLKYYKHEGFISGKIIK